MTSLWCSRVLRALGLVAIVVIQLAWLNQPVPVALKLFDAALIAVSIWRPGVWTDVVLASLGPLSTGMSNVFGSAIAASHLLEQMILAVVMGQLVRWRSTDAQTWTAGPAAVVAAVAVASAAAILPAQAFSSAPDMSAWQFVTALWRGDYFGGTALWAPLSAAMIVVEGMALVWTVESLIRRERPLAERVVGVSLAAHATAAALTISKVLGAVIRGGGVIAQLPMLLAVRASLEYPDVNAAGSVLVLVFLSGVSFMKRPWWRVVLSAAALALGASAACG